MNPLIQLKPIALFLAAIACFAVSPASRAVSPPPDGGYPENNTAEGTDALFSLQTGGTNNTAIGFQALYHNTFGDENTASGAFALFSNTTGRLNTANGFNALFDNTIGVENTAIGNNALFDNTTGSLNTAIGVVALSSNLTGSGNTATGVAALARNATGNRNTANGLRALGLNTIGSLNTANGVDALSQNETGNNNAAYGVDALFSNTTGGFNTANGFRALFSNTIGNRNIALGPSAGANLTTGSNNIDIGNAGVADESGTIRVGTGGIQTRTFVAGIRGVTTGAANAVPVLIDSAGQLGTMSSSLRFKKEIKPMDQTSEAILALKPVTFHYKSDETGTPQFGLIAEEVAQVNPDLVVPDENGKPYTVRYEAVNAMLLNEFLKEHRKVEQLQKQVEALTAGLQKVSAQLEVSKPVPQTVLNNQ
jgi:hypothetical protein